MYYPYLRGRQNELLSIKELVQTGKLSQKVIPVIEPVKLSPTLVSTIDAFEKSNHELILVINPDVGDFSSDCKKAKNAKYLEKLRYQVKNYRYISRGLIAEKNAPHLAAKWKEAGVTEERIVAICNNVDSIKYLLDANITNSRKIIPASPSFDGIKNQRIWVNDYFTKLKRNSDYQNLPDEFFSDAHLLFSQHDFIGFSDYSIIGEEYSEAGFAPYAVAIHIVYFDEHSNLRVKHFVSADNDDISDPANKFYQALAQLIAWAQTQKITTVGLSEFERIFNEQSYPGLGVVKKLSIMHHLELMSQYLDEEK